MNSASAISTLAELRQKSRWLNALASSVHSQHGEDGIIRKILETFPERDGWCVEFGAWDGKYLSTTHRLMTEEKYRGVLIEGSAAKFKDLQETYRGNDRAILLNRMVGLEGPSSLDSILGATSIPKNFDFLSIDVDGTDYHIWASLKEYHPKLVCIEFNASIPSEVDFVQPADSGVSQGNSILAMVRLGKEKGYELVATTRCNAFFVARSYYPLFNIPDNSIEILREDFYRMTHVFFGYDGTVFYRGHCLMPWHGLSIQDRKMQLLPRFLRRHPDEYTGLHRFLLKWWLRWKARF